MNETNTTMTATKPTTDTEFHTMLQHLYTSTRKTQIHLTAYSEETTSPELIDKSDVPDIDDYDFQGDRKATDEMLATSQRILDHMEQHRATYYPSHPVFEDTTSDTTTPWQYFTRRSRNACEAAAWVCTAHAISLAYTTTLPGDAPAAADARELADELSTMLGMINDHGEQYTNEGGIDISATISTAEHLDEMNPNYRAWVEEAEEQN